uniref:Peptidyl-prolyl cis-trans isomerase n=1 Tax=Spumella elongata TaxID=89044 RepID=A0A7S3HLL8_9STRA|mmetsp:Transcript_57069/g.100199  ORF Transcript_57069/g.100199 Transcript_57069/m.100199 type:complete len:260 (+) Transcript_57069:3-782(+)
MLNPMKRLGSIGSGEYSWVGKVALGISCCLPTYFFWEWVDTQRKVREYQKAIGDKVFMDIGIGNKYAGRILIGLYSERVPLTCENFLQLCKGYQIKDKVVGYRNTFFHLIRPGSALVGGDVLTGTGKSHGLSIYGEGFPDENFEMEFLRDGDLAMVNWGKNTNSSIFMITLSSQRVYYGHHVVFGTVLKGMRLVREMGELGTRVGRPALPIRVLACGVLEKGAEEPGPPEGFMPPVGPLLTEDEFRATNLEKPGTNQPN